MNETGGLNLIWFEQQGTSRTKAFNFKLQIILQNVTAYKRGLIILETFFNVDYRIMQNRAYRLAIILWLD
jgi:hypothetical protein